MLIDYRIALPRYHFFRKIFLNLLIVSYGFIHPMTARLNFQESRRRPVCVAVAAKAFRVSENRRGLYENLVAIELWKRQLAGKIVVF